MFWLSAIFRRPGSDPMDPTQCDASQRDYVNGTRAFVMEPGFPLWAGSCENHPRETLDPPLPAAGGLFDRWPRICPARGAGERESNGIDGYGLHGRRSSVRSSVHVRRHAVLPGQVGTGGLRPVPVNGALRSDDVAGAVTGRHCRNPICHASDAASRQRSRSGKRRVLTPSKTSPIPGPFGVTPKFARGALWRPRPCRVRG